LKKNNTSGSEPVSKSTITFDLNVSSDVAELSSILFPVSLVHAAQASL
jgi:hypothetical protein